MCEQVFQQYSDYERIEKFSRPKVFRLLEILRIYRPPAPVRPARLTDATDADKAINADNAADSVKAEQGSEQVDKAEVILDAECQIVDPAGAELPETTSQPIPPETDTNVPLEPAQPGETSHAEVAPQNAQPTAPLPHFNRRRRPDFIARHPRNRDDVHQLCGIIFAERRTTAKLLYHLLKVTSC